MEWSFCSIGGSNLKTSLLAVLLAGLVIRIVLATFTGHPYDLTLWTYSARLFYETGQFDYYFPTLLPLYYVQLAFYSFYVMLRMGGFTDYIFMYHTSYMVETLFLKLPMILSDLGIYLAMLQFTRKLRYAALYYLNPLSIYLSSVWGMYDSVMMLPMVTGFLLLARERRTVAGISFFVSGLVKVFGFIPFGLLLLDSLVHRRFKELIIQSAVGALFTLVVLFPLVMANLQDFYTGFVLRIVGAAGYQSRGYSPIAIISGYRFGGSPPFIWLALGLTVALFLFQSRRSPTSTSVLLASVVGAVLLNIFSQSEPQWLLWIIPPAILFSHISGKEGLAHYTYFFGVATTFLIMTLTQSTGYLLTGVPSVVLEGLEGYSNSLVVYVVTVSGMLALLMGYVFIKPQRFRMEILAFTVLLYVQAYFWFTIVRVVNV